jgi:hypothetical protein
VASDREHDGNIVLSTLDPRFNDDVLDTRWGRDGRRRLAAHLVLYGNRGRSAMVSACPGAPAATSPARRIRTGMTASG